MNANDLSSTQFDVEHYGRLVERLDKPLRRNKPYNEFLTLKVYVFEERYFVETWFNGECLNFRELPI